MNEFHKELTDKFATIALQQLLRDDLSKSTDKQMGSKWVCKTSYVIAQEMMEARHAYYAAKTA